MGGGGERGCHQTSVSQLAADNTEQNNMEADMGEQGSTARCSAIGWVNGYRGWCMMSFCSQASMGDGGGPISGFNCVILKVAVQFLSYPRVMLLLQCLY